MADIQLSPEPLQIGIAESPAVAISVIAYNTQAGWVAPYMLEPHPHALKHYLKFFEQADGTPLAALHGP